ncbi:Uncharacterized glycosyltransferase YpjH (fragment) [Capnocytophaga canimorsus]|uniref:Uncharacterized glycosyltransferase YpjH n=1 Tax=Capnocytophaga canimorsus TaxID=28188 RepID=A0A0B7H0D3_9FLAO
MTSVSESLKQDTLRLFDIEKEVVVIPNFINIAKEIRTNPCPRDLMAETGERIVTHISNFRKVKRISDVIEVFYRIQMKIPAKLILVGEGPEKEAAEQQCKDLGIKHKVRFLGNSLDVDRILCLSDLFLLPSESESFGLAALEAMAAGVPVIATNVGGLPEVIENGFSGFLSPLADVNTMANSAIHILQDDTTLKKFKEQARISALRFDENKIIPLYENLYYEVKKQN